ncbi:hypothetical protein RND81_01G019600 [Saponaria officinalis]|uniref:Uncharacterized protein n=1 Tax=Saponaria officinalis TaxID=3572 RepID=A0AAW1NB99_SAPOF
MKTIWDEFTNYSHVPQCTCGAAATLAKEREEEKVHQFLMGLDTSLYGNIRTNRLMEDNITSLSRAYALVLREERHRAVTKSKEEVADAAMAARTTSGEVRGHGFSPRSDSGEIKPVRCTHCNKWYHTEENCWEKHPEKYAGRGRGRGRRGGRGHGYGRGSRGQNNESQVANAATTSSDGNNSFFSQEEVVQLRSLLQTKSEGSTKLPGMDINWLLDSAASHHMTGKYSLLANIRKGAPSTVSLPNGM